LGAGTRGDRTRGPGSPVQSSSAVLAPSEVPFRAVTLARMWRRQLLAASSAALIVPSAMLAALLVLALSGGFSQLGVLGQIFAGPPAPSAGSVALAGAAAGAGARSGGGALPVIPVAHFVAGRPRRGT